MDAAPSNDDRGVENRRPPVTLRMIADAAGVHVSTASRALNPTEAGKLRPETLQRVRRTALELGYEPNPWARSLRTRRSLMIGLLLPRLVDGVLAIMFESAEDRARWHGYHAVTTSTRDHENEERHLVEALLDRRVDGLVLATPTVDDPLLADLAGRDVPFVVMNRSSDTHPCVRGDDELGGYLATRHLLEQGHERIGMIAGPPNTSTALGRRAGFDRAYAEAGIAPDATLVRPSRFSHESGWEVGHQLFARPDPPTAVFAVNDATAIGAMAAARDRQLAVPDDVAVVGYNDSPLARMLPVQLSSVAIPIAEIGARAVDLLIARLQGEQPESIVYPPMLQVRASSLRTVRKVTGGAVASP